MYRINGGGRADEKGGKEEEGGGGGGGGSDAKLNSREIGESRGSSRRSKLLENLQRGRISKGHR